MGWPARSGRPPAGNGSPQQHRSLQLPHHTRPRTCRPGASTTMRSCWCSCSCLAASAVLGTCQVSMEVTASSSATNAATRVLNCSGSAQRQVMCTCGAVVRLSWCGWVGGKSDRWLGTLQEAAMLVLPGTCGHPAQGSPGLPGPSPRSLAPHLERRVPGPLLHDGQSKGGGCLHDVKGDLHLHRLAVGQRGIDNQRARKGSGQRAGSHACIALLQPQHAWHRLSLRGERRCEEGSVTEG